MLLPNKNEYNPYFQKYINLVDQGEFLPLLDINTQTTIEFFANIPTQKHNYKYGLDKWTIKEILMHIIDTERVMANRAFVCLRGDNTTILHSMDENKYAANVDVSQRTMKDMIEEFIMVRGNTKFLFQYATEEQMMFLGQGETYNFSARALGLIMIGHILHHFSVIRERYL